MNNKTRVSCGFMALSWSLFLIFIALCELKVLTLESATIPLILFGTLTAVSITLFIVYYLRGRKSVNKLKEEYLNSLKPKAPIRFVPSDEDLLTAYKRTAEQIEKRRIREMTGSNQNTIAESKNINNSKTPESSNEEEEMMN